jgi:hypothetical protein
MNELTESLRKFHDAPAAADPIGELGEAAVKWSAYCIRNLRGDLLDRGLAISKALAEFDCGLLHPETLKD